MNRPRVKSNDIEVTDGRTNRASPFAQSTENERHCGDTKSSDWRNGVIGLGRHSGIHELVFCEAPQRTNFVSLLKSVRCASVCVRACVWVVASSDLSLPSSCCFPSFSLFSSSLVFIKHYHLVTREECVRNLFHHGSNRTCLPGIDPRRCPTKRGRLPIRRRIRL